MTFTTLVDKPSYAFIIWNFNHEGESVHVATVSPSAGLKVNAPYEGRVSINATNGYLTMTSLKSDDSGDYGISIVSPDGVTQTAEIQLRVLGKSR